MLPGISLPILFLWLGWRGGIEGTEALLASRGESRAERLRRNSQDEIPAGALVIVETEAGAAGSGFIAQLRERVFFVTNIHVLAAARGAKFTTVNGREVHLPDVAFLSHQRDLAIVPIAWSGD